MTIKCMVSKAVSYYFFFFYCLFSLQFPTNICPYFEVNCSIFFILAEIQGKDYEAETVVEQQKLQIKHFWQNVLNRPYYTDHVTLLPKQQKGL